MTRFALRLAAVDLYQRAVLQLQIDAVFIGGDGDRWLVESCDGSGADPDRDDLAVACLRRSKDPAGHAADRNLSFFTCPPAPAPGLPLAETVVTDPLSTSTAQIFAGIPAEPDTCTVAAAMAPGSDCCAQTISPVLGSIACTRKIIPVAADAATPASGVPSGESPCFVPEVLTPPAAAEAPASPKTTPHP